MQGEKLAAMANQIARFFRAYPDDEAVAGIAEHLVAFWTPGMRATLLDRASHADTAVDPLVLQALRTSPDGESPISKEVSGPEEVGQLGSDAG